MLYAQLVQRMQSELELTEPRGPDIALLTEAWHHRRRHSLETLWRAELDPNDVAESRLIEAEIAALVEVLHGRVGPQRLFRLLPALRDFAWLGDALPAVFGIDPYMFAGSWSASFRDLIGVASESAPAITAPSAIAEPPPAILSHPNVPLGDAAANAPDHCQTRASPVPPSTEFPMPN
jgi:hypothetical protein